MLTSIFITLVVIALIYWVITQLGLPEPVQRIAVVILVIAAVLYLLKFVGVALP